MRSDTTRVVQLTHPEHGRRVALVQEPFLVLLRQYGSVYQLGLDAIQKGISLKTFIHDHLSEERLIYTAVYEDHDEWKILPSFDHPDAPMSCVISGTGLTHKTSAMNRQMMHATETGKLTDSMQMYQWGLEGGFPASGAVGVQPEWFYKGTGVMLRAHNQKLDVPPYSNDGGEEPEVAGIYIVDAQGQPWRLGFTTGNEFSDHVMERRNYLYLAPSKLRSCAIGPELVIDGNFTDISGEVRIIRNDNVLWSKKIRTGEQGMAHSLANLEHHHFKYACHRVPFQAHVHFFGADAFSFGEQVTLEAGDGMQIQWEGMGRPLYNILSVTREPEQLVRVRTVI